MPLRESRASKRVSGKTNWVQVAVELAGGATTVAKELGVSRQAVHRWMMCGSMADAATKHTVRLVQLSNIPIDRLLGPG